MPDQHQPTTEPSTIPCSEKEKQKTYLETLGNLSEGRRSIHLVTNSKGGIGKSLVASFVAQYLNSRGEPLVCFDADTQNASLSDIKTLAAIPVHILSEDGIAVNVLDELIERFATEDTNFVVDNGSTTFEPLCNHLITYEAVEAFSSTNKRIIVHAIMVGGRALFHCAKGLAWMAQIFPPNVEFVVWLNEFFGPIDDAENPFESSPVYQTHKNRIIGIIRLTQLNKHTFGANFKEMVDRCLTFAEADKSPDFFIMTKQRLRQIQRPIWEQLNRVL